MESELPKGANVCSTEKDTKHSSNTLLRLVSFSAEQTLIYNDVSKSRDETHKNAI